MARQTFVLRNGILVEKHLAAPLPGQGSAFVISDTMDAVAHPITGQLMDSKSQFRRVTRAYGCVEVGNDRAPARRDSFDSAALKREIAHAMRNPDRSAAARASEFIGGWE